MITIKVPQIKFSKSKLVTKATLVELGNRVFAANYRSRMMRGLGVDADGAVMPHKPLSAKAARQGRPGRPPLVLTGRMAGSFHVDQSRTTGDTLTLDFSPAEREKAMKHQHGDPSRRLPARPHIGPADEDIAGAIDFLRERISQTIDKLIIFEE